MDYMDDDSIMEQEAEHWAAENDSKLIFDEFDDPVDEFFDEFEEYK